VEFVTAAAAGHRGTLFAKHDYIDVISYVYIYKREKKVNNWYKRKVAEWRPPDNIRLDRSVVRIGIRLKNEKTEKTVNDRTKDEAKINTNDVYLERSGGT